MLKNKEIQKQHKILEKKNIIKKFLINRLEQDGLQEYIEILKKFNKHTNLVGKSTLVNPWLSHILDSLQILKFIKHKKLSILDMGTGAGLPGLVLSICGCKNVTLVDSNGKKINFLFNIKRELGLKTNIILGRLETLENKHYDVVVTRALANLEKLFTYSQKFIKKNTVLIFLKGKTVNEEILDAKKKWNFQHKKHTSLSDSRGCVLVIWGLKKND